MASPFKHFRKHQKAMLAVIGILTMLAFTILPSVMDQMGGAMSAQDPIVATANGENIRESDMGQMRRARFLANKFVAGCFQMALKEQFFMARFQYGSLLEQFFGEATDESVVETRLLAERAHQIGLVISDDAVNEFLRGLTQDKVPAEGFKSLVRELGTTQGQLFNALRNELAAQRMREMSLPGGEATPAQRWDYYRRLKQRAVVEAAPVFVAEFADEVADPSPEELAKFFEDHKRQEPQPLSPTPGFKIPKKAAFQYFVADYDKFYDEAAVTQEEIEKHYEQYKDQRYLFSSFDFPEATDDKAPDAGKDEAQKPAADGAKPADAKPADDKPAEDEPAEDKPAEDKPAEDKPADKPDQQSSVLRGISQLAVASNHRGASRALAGLIESSLFADEKSEDAGSPDASQKPAEDKPAEKNAAAPDDAAADANKEASEGQPSDDNPSQPEPKQGPDAPPRSTAKPPAGLSPPISDDLLLPGEIGQGAKPKYAPLWKVEDSIRKELAGQKAVERMTAAFAPIQAKMNRFTRNLDPDEKQPKLPDLSGLAKEQDLAEQTTESLTGLEFKERHPGLADASPDQQSFNERPRHFIDIGYGNMAVFQSAVVKDLEGDRYLVWKIDQKEAYIPEL
ncbi:MAG TPA: SurA N-terminal domain-containing protein, partial [Pirellulales bacterium]|nr:SurA N-terminal domain-containing protein [Pirellulales bacterium]